MTSRQRKIALTFRIFIDLVFVSFAWLLSYYLRFYTFIPASKGIPDFSPYVKLTPFIWVIWFVTFHLTGLYRRSLHRRSVILESIDFIQNCLLATVFFVSITYFYNEFRYSRATVIIFLFLQPFVLILGRSLLRKILRFYRKKTPVKEILFIGNQNFFYKIKNLPSYDEIEGGYIKGAIFIGSEGSHSNSIKNIDGQDLNIFNIPDDWPSFFVKNHFEAVIIALAHQDYSFFDTHLAAIADQITNIQIIPDILKFTRFTSNVELIGNVPVISIHDSPLSGFGQIIKRVIDILGSLFAIVIFSPIMAICSLFILLTSPGPIFYRQQRMGLDGHVFDILKFRSMPVNSEEKTGAVWATKEDNRPTPFGQILRKTSLDEIPQFFNVLKGDMSLVGPRPERPVFVNQFRRDVPGYMLRHKVKSGITGWAQVNGWRGNTSIERRIQCDLYYIQNWSIWFDIKIIVLTIFKGFIHPNAY